MRILDLFERRLQKTSYAFHGTSDVFLDSIMKHGLDPNPPQRKFDGIVSNDPRDIGVDERSLESFSGIYLSRTLPLSWNHALGTQDKFGGEQIVVGIQFTESSVGADEDNIYAWIDSIIRPAHHESSRKLDITTDALMDELYKGNSELIDEIVFWYIDTFTISEKAPIHEPIETIFKIIAANIMNPKTASWQTWLKDIHRSSDWQAFRTAMFKLMEITREEQYRPNKKVFRINRPIKFRGKTRIVVILRLTNQDTHPKVIWGEMPDLPNPVRLS